MVFSRFWYLVVGVAVAGALFLAYVAVGVTNKNSERTSARLLTANSVAVGLYLKDDAARRANALTQLAVTPELADVLRKAQTADTLKDVDSPLRTKAAAALRKYREQPQDFVAFDALWVVDVHGRVVASDNFEKAANAEGFEMGGYPVVADALHGYIRDDTWLMDDEVWRIVARPVETEVGAAPVGALVAGKKLDDAIARDVVAHTGAAIVFYGGGQFVAKATPPASDTHLVNLTREDIAKLRLLGPEDGYQEQGISKPQLLQHAAGYDLRAVFTRLPGEAWDMGAGFAVMHQYQRIVTPADFYSLATDEEKRSVPLPLLLGVALVLALVGFFFTGLEHGAPLAGFKRGLTALAKKGNAIDVLKPSTYRGPYKELAALVNDALDKVASTAGIDRGPADLQQVLGPLPTAPVMSAFALHGSSDGTSPKAALPVRSLPTPKLPSAPIPAKARPLVLAVDGAPLAIFDEPTQVNDASTGRMGELSGGAMRDAGGLLIDEPTAVVDDVVMRRQAGQKPQQGPGSGHAPAQVLNEPVDEETEWQRVYEEFIQLKNQLSEPTEKVTYEKFRGTLQRNKDALVARHGCSRVAFKVYEKQGRAALKASPMK